MFITENNFLFKPPSHSKLILFVPTTKTIILKEKNTSWRNRRCPEIKIISKKLLKIDLFLTCHPQATQECPKNVNPFGQAVWPVIGNMYTNVLFYYIDMVFFNQSKNFIFDKNSYKYFCDLT